MSKSTKGIIELWGEEAVKQFLRMPTELLYHYKNINMSDEDLTIIAWIDLHQWGTKAAFPHPAKLADVLKVSEAEASEKLHSLKERGYITLEPTRNGSRNFHQDIRPTRNRLRDYLNKHPDHCKIIKLNLKDKGIDISNNRNSYSTDASIKVDTSIPQRGGTESAGEILNKKKKNR